MSFSSVLPTDKRIIVPRQRIRRQAQASQDFSLLLPVWCVSMCAGLASRFLLRCFRSRLFMILTRPICLTDSGDFLDETPSQTSRCSQLGSFLPETRQQGFPLCIDERHTAQIDLRTTTLIYRHFMAIGLELLYPRTGKTPFQNKPHRMGCNTLLSSDL